MAIARITGPGLSAMAVSVALLWTCLIAERTIVHRTIREQTQVLHEMEQLRQRQRSEPVSEPRPLRFHRLRDGRAG
jgi:hypothetical protein